MLLQENNLVTVTTPKLTIILLSIITVSSNLPLLTIFHSENNNTDCLPISSHDQCNEMFLKQLHSSHHLLYSSQKQSLTVTFFLSIYPTVIREKKFNKLAKFSVLNTLPQWKTYNLFVTNGAGQRSRMQVQDQWDAYLHCNRSNIYICT